MQKMLHFPENMQKKICLFASFGKMFDPFAIFCINGCKNAYFKKF